jgi:DNA processing protein
MGARTLKALAATYNGDLEAVLRADEAALRQVRGVGVKIAQAVRHIDLAQTAQRLAQWQADGVEILTLHDPRYPSRLRALHDAPPTLFKQGTDTLANLPKTLAIVGTRHPTPNGLACATHAAHLAAESGYAIVSGLALGIDSAAHLAASAYTLRQFAVLGSGLLRLYPPQNRALAQAIQAQGALLCEVAPDTAVSAAGLVARNRIISGLADAVIVVESSTDGGAMYAAMFAQRQGRPVYTFDLNSSGNHALLAQGAHRLTLDSDSL